MPADALPIDAPTDSSDLKFIWLRRLLFWAGSFGSIGVLLGHVHAIGPMGWLALTVWLPLALVMLGVYVWARRVGDRDFLLRVKAGLLGGVWGTIAYDLVRMPFHAMGFGLFLPIRGFGVWLTGATYSTPWTDAWGLAYHFSNGICFGWAYSFLVWRRHWAWALVWGLLIEAMAVYSAFGEVFAIRKAYPTLVVAYGAHLFYGIFLGWTCQNPERVLQTTLPLHKTGRGLLTLFLLAFVVIWFLSVWQPVLNQPHLATGKIVAGPDALYPGWCDLPVEHELEISNALPEPIVLRLKRPEVPLAEAEPITLGPGETRAVQLSQTGIHQLLAPDKPWRSILIAVHRSGDYRQRPAK